MWRKVAPGLRGYHSITRHSSREKKELFVHFFINSCEPKSQSWLEEQGDPREMVTRFEGRDFLGGVKPTFFHVNTLAFLNSPNRDKSGHTGHT